MRFKDWIGFLFNILIFFIIGIVIIALFGGAAAESGSSALWPIIIGIAVMFGGPWWAFRSAQSGYKCAECGKKWSLEKDGYRDGETTELHERNSSGDLKLVHKWDRYQDWKCKNCGDVTTEVIEKTRTV